MIAQGCTTTAADNHPDHHQPAHQQPQRPKPEHRRFTGQGRVVAHELAIAVDHEINDLLIALAFAEHAENLPAQVSGNRCVGIRNVLVLTLGATQLLGQFTKTITFGVVGELIGVNGGMGQAAQRQPQGHRS